MREKRNKTKEVMIGKLTIGGRNPLRIKGMLKTSTSDIEGILREAKSLEEEGVEAIRLAIKNKTDIEILGRLRDLVSVPIVADVHFDYRLALLSIEAGFDGIRLNPLNIFKKKEVKEVAKELKKAKISLRVGINAGGFKKKFTNNYVLAKEMVKRVSDYINLIEGVGFFDTIVSLKTSNVWSTLLANKEFARRFNYPLHLGITATGPFLEGVVKSCLGIGTMLSEGLGDIIRVSLTAPSFWEIRVAKFILQFLELRKFFPEIISCPTCSRCEVDLMSMVDKFRDRISKAEFSSFPSKIALMGCVVNGPGEAYQADIGIAFGKKKAVIFKNNKIVGWTNEKKALDDLLDKIGGSIWK